jgi:hypothetical protein
MKSSVPCAGCQNIAWCGHWPRSEDAYAKRSFVLSVVHRCCAQEAFIVARQLKVGWNQTVCTLILSRWTSAIR